MRPTATAKRSRSRWEDILLDVLSRDISEVLRTRAALVCADTMVAASAARNQPELNALNRTAASGPAAVVTNGSRRIAVEDAALINATAGTWLELDEAAHSGVHAAVHVLMPAFAIAQAREASGRDLLDAFILGYESVAELYSAYEPRYPVHPHGGFAVVGGAVAVARLTNQDPLDVARIASTLPITTSWDACFEGATARHALAGYSAVAAISASRLAGAGFTGSSLAADSWFGSIVGDAKTVDPLSSPHLLRNSFKFHSACLTCHSAIDAALTLGPAERIARVVIETTHDVAEKVARRPVAQPLSTKFSIQYAVAAAIWLGRSDPSAFEHDSDIAALAQSIEVRVVDDLPSTNHSMPARVTVTDRSGTRSREVHFPNGHHSRAVTVEELRRKSVAIAGGSDVFDDFLAIGKVSNCASISL
jgi:2-methylcitrate dehydratase PrpD